MTIVYEPSKLLRDKASKNKIEKLITKGASLKKSALNLVASIDFLKEETVKRVALSAIKNYKKRIKEDPKIKKELVRDPKLLIQRLQNLVVFEASREIRKKYMGEFYVWLPSDAREPDPLHQLKYGKTYQIGVGEMPQDRYGCRCGMEIITPDSRLEI